MNNFINILMIMMIPNNYRGPPGGSWERQVRVRWVVDNACEKDLCRGALRHWHFKRMLMMMMMMMTMMMMVIFWSFLVFFLSFTCLWRVGSVADGSGMLISSGSHSTNAQNGPIWAQMMMMMMNTYMNKYMNNPSDLL